MNDLKKKYDSLQTTEEKRLFALSTIKDKKMIDVISYPKIAETSISILFYKYIGLKYEVKRTYKAKHQDNKNI